MAIRSNHGPSRRVYNWLIAHRVSGVFVAVTPHPADAVPAADTRDVELDENSE